MKKICSYEEEETKIFPHLIIRHNIETEEFSKLVPVEIIHMAQESNGKLFFKRLKLLLPFCNNGWRVYVDVGESKVNFGIIRNFSGIEGLTVDEVLSDTNKSDLAIIRQEYKIGYFTINPINDNEFDIVVMDGEKVRINFSLQPSQNSSEEQKEMFIRDFLSQSKDEKLFRAMKNHVNKKAFNYYRLKIDCNGKLEFDTFCDSSRDETEDWSKICYAYDFAEDKHRGVQNQVEGLMYSDIDNIHVILLTKEKTLPNIEALMNTLKETDDKEKISKEVLMKAMNDFETEYPDSVKSVLEWRSKLTEKFGMITKKELKKILNMRTSVASTFNRFLHENYNIWVDGELRKAEFEATFQIGNLLNIKFEYTTNDYLDGNAFVYYVGAKSKKCSYPNACCMRKVISLGDHLESEELLPLMAVEFVRNSQYTVLPFPYKYLREYMEQC